MGVSGMFGCGGSEGRKTYDPDVELNGAANPGGERRPGPVPADRDLVEIVCPYGTGADDDESGTEEHQYDDLLLQWKLQFPDSRHGENHNNEVSDCVDDSSSEEVLGFRNTGALWYQG